jgi:hypothetical protein
MKTKVSIQRIATISDDDKGALYALHSQYFDNTNITTFLLDFCAKDWVILTKREDGKFIGFSTIQVINLHYNGELHLFMFSGDTIISPEAWQSNVLAPAIGLFQSWLIEQNPDVKIFWFLISKGYRTYKGLSTFYNIFYPCFNCEMPMYYADILQLIAQYKFGDRYNPITNIISFEKPKDFLCSELQQIPSGREQDPHVDFFLKKNTGYIKGDELACIAELSKANFNRTALRVIEIGKKTVDWSL